MCNVTDTLKQYLLCFKSNLRPSYILTSKPFCSCVNHIEKARMLLYRFERWKMNNRDNELRGKLFSMYFWKSKKGVSSKWPLQLVPYRWSPNLSFLFYWTWLTSFIKYLGLHWWKKQCNSYMVVFYIPQVSEYDLCLMPLSHAKWVSVLAFRSGSLT